MKSLLRGSPTRNVLVLVLLEMAVEVGLLTEAAVAQVTLEGFLLVVDVANVALQVGRDAERAVTVLTPAGAHRTTRVKTYNTAHQTVSLRLQHEHDKIG